jgi:hypothetical protein
MWCCGVSSLGIGIGARFEVVLPDGSRVSVKGSPGLELRRHVANELFAPTPTAVVRAIDRICIVSSDGAVEYCTTSLTWSITRAEPRLRQVQVSGSITPTAPITVGYFRAKAGDILYFESAVSPTFDVVAGQTVSLTATLTFSTTHSPSVSGGLPSVASVDTSGLLALLVDIIRGARPSGQFLTLTRVRWAYIFDAYVETRLSVSLTRSYTAGATSGSASHDFTAFTSSGGLNVVYVDCAGRDACIAYTLSSTLSVTTSDMARYSISVSVG